jgi:hypothetical protein
MQKTLKYSRVAATGCVVQMLQCWGLDIARSLYRLPPSTSHKFIEVISNLEGDRRLLNPVTDLVTIRATPNVKNCAAQTAKK